MTGTTGGEIANLEVEKVTVLGCGPAEYLHACFIYSYLCVTSCLHGFGLTHGCLLACIFSSLLDSAKTTALPSSRSYCCSQRRSNKSCRTHEQTDERLHMAIRINANRGSIRVTGVDSAKSAVSPTTTGEAGQRNQPKQNLQSASSGHLSIVLLLQCNYPSEKNCSGCSKVFLARWRIAYGE